MYAMQHQKIAKKAKDTEKMQHHDLIGRCCRKFLYPDAPNISTTDHDKLNNKT